MARLITINSIDFNIAEVVQKKLTPFRNPRKSGGSPKGVNDPPILATRKIKKTIVCTLYCRCALARMRGLINNMAAPVVPIQLAKNVPTNISTKLVIGVANTWQQNGFVMQRLPMHHKQRVFDTMVANAL